MDLFQTKEKHDREPLASRMRPRNLDDFAGQDHIVGMGRLLRRSIQADQLSSLIFYGPPGTGKTTLARVIAGTTKSKFISLNAVLSGVKEIRTAIEEAKDSFSLYDKKTILFVDEVHRWNKAQQDALLPWVENGTFILIGATTENPYFEVNSALVSRSRIFQLKELDDLALVEIANNALEHKSRGYGKWKVTYDKKAMDHLIKISSGDARTLLNALQLAVETSVEVFPPPEETKIHIDLKTAEESIQQKAILYDKEGDYHFDTISAFIKSIRGSDPDATLYWMAKMIRAGEDPKFILRRMIISASEDIGMADPKAIEIVTSAAAAYDRIGMPEGAFPLTQAALYLATAPKSNSTMAYFDALKVVIEEENHEVPNHLKDPSRDKKSFGHGEDYNYPHAYRDHWVAQAYLPDELKGRFFYKPSSIGYEAEIQEEVIKKREAQMAVMIETNKDEVLTYSPGDKNRDRWVNRITSGQGPLLQKVRDEIFNISHVQRHERVLIAKEQSGLFLWEAFRKAPEGLVCGLIPTEREFALTEHYSQTLPENERPFIYNKKVLDFTLLDFEETKGVLFDCILARDLLTDPKKNLESLIALKKILAKRGRFTIAELDRTEGTKLSDFLKSNIDDDLLNELKQIESEMYNSREFLNLSGINKLLEQTDYLNVWVKSFTFHEERIILPEQLNRWLSLESKNSYGYEINKKLGQKKYKIIKDQLSSYLSGASVIWDRSYNYVYGENG